MMSEINIKRILRRHLNFEGIILTQTYSQLVLNVVKECLHTQNMSKKDYEKKFKKIRKVNY